MAPLISTNDNKPCNFCYSILPLSVNQGLRNISVDVIILKRQSIENVYGF